MNDDRRLIVLADAAASSLAADDPRAYRLILRQLAPVLRRPSGSSTYTAIARQKGDRALRLAHAMDRLIGSSPELRRLASRVERRYPDSLFATVVRALTVPTTSD
jgi:hypothetical protein